MSIIAEQYIQDVLSGAVPAGSPIIKAFHRHKSDLVNGKARGLYFDPTAGDYVIDFIEQFCGLTLCPWQHAMIYITYGWKRADGLRRFRRFYLEIAKKAGKSGITAALAIYHLVADGETNAHCYCAATTGKQAHRCFDQSVSMRKAPELRNIVHQTGNAPVIALYTDDNNRLSCMSRDAAHEDGAEVTFAVLDEFHQWIKSAKGMHSVLRYGTRTRKQPMLAIATTAGASAGGTTMCWEEHEYAMAVLDGRKEDDEYAPWIFSLDKNDDWKDPANWVKSNPSLGYLFDLETILKEYAETEGKPSDLAEFRRFALNIWSEDSDDPAIDIEAWEACCRVPLDNYPDPTVLRKESLTQLAGRPCFGGLDLAPKNDTSSLVLIFPPTTQGEKWRVLEWFWCPNDNIIKRVKKDRVDYHVWRDKGFITATPGNLTDVRYIADELVKINKLFDLRELYYDQAWSSELIRLLGETDNALHQKCVEFPQWYTRMNGPCTEFVRKVLKGEFAHDRHPVMRWQMSNLRWKTQKNTGFVMPDKDRKREKIDGPAALIMALACATSPDNQITPKRKLWVVSSK